MRSAGAERFGLGVTNCRRATDVVDAVREAEARGAEIAFIAEDINCRDAFQLCALAAQVTRSMRLSTGVVNPFTRNPTSLAMATATLDEVSQGRAALGLGTSSPSLIQGQMGISHTGSIDVMREATDIVRSLLQGEEVTYRGDHFQYVGARLEIPVQESFIPIFFAGMGPRILNLAGRMADGVLLNVGASTDYVRWAIEQVRAGEAQAGRPVGAVSIAAWLTVYVTDDFDDGLKRARTWLSTMLSIPGQGELLLEHAGFDSSILGAIRSHVRAYPHGGDPVKAGASVPDEVVEKLTLVGTLEHIRARVQEYRSAGVDVPVLPAGVIRALS